MIMLKLESSCNSSDCKHGYNSIVINKNGLNSNRIGFVNNVKKYICSRLNLNKNGKNFFFVGLVCYFVSINNEYIGVEV